MIKLLKGNPTLFDLTREVVRKKTDLDLARVVLGPGRRRMPSFKAYLTEDEVRRVITYLRKFTPPDDSAQNR